MTSMSLRIHLAAALAALCIVLSAVGCGDDLVIGGMLLPTATPQPTETPGACSGGGVSCNSNADCCSLVCDATSFTCL